MSEEALTLLFSLASLLVSSRIHSICSVSLRHFRTYSAEPLSFCYIRERETERDRERETETERERERDSTSGVIH